MKKKLKIKINKHLYNHVKESQREMDFKLA